MKGNSIKEKNIFIKFYQKINYILLLEIILSFIGIYLVVKSHYTIAVLLLFCCGLCDIFDNNISLKISYNNPLFNDKLRLFNNFISFILFPACLTYAILNNIIIYIICLIYTLYGIINLSLNTKLENKKDSLIKEQNNSLVLSAFLYPVIFVITRFINFDYLKYILPVIIIILGILQSLNLKKVLPLIKKIFNTYTLNIIIFPLFIYLITEFFYKSNFITFKVEDILLTIKTHFLAFILIFGLILSLYWLCISIFKKSIYSKIIFIILITILMVVNDVKFKIMGHPVDLSDINFLNSDNIEMIGIFSTSMSKEIFKALIKSLYIIIPGVILIGLDNKVGFVFKNTRKRIITLIGTIAIWVLVIVLMINNSSFLLKNIYSLEGDEITNLPASETFYYDYGFYQGVILNNLAVKPVVPDNYKSSIPKELLAKVNKENTDFGKANVVFILSESLFDVTNIDEITFSQDPLTNIKGFDNLDNADSFNVLVEPFGGSSTNSEFEILTGASLSFWKYGATPYNQYYNFFTMKNSPHLIKEFDNNGYETMYITPWGKASYHSEVVYQGVGTKTLLYDSDVKCPNKGMYCSDEYFLNYLYEELEDTDENHLKFIMSATGQNHGPHSYDRYETYDIEVVESSFNEEQTGVLQAYAQGLYDADMTLLNLYDKIQEIDTPTIVVFFGDHLPFLIDDIYKTASYFNTEDANINDIRIHTTRGVIFTNYDVELEDFDYINLSYLGAYIANHMDIQLSSYFSFVDNMHKEIPLFNRNGIYNYKDNTFILNANLDQDKQELLTNYRYVQYYSFYDY